MESDLSGTGNILRAMDSILRVHGADLLLPSKQSFGSTRAPAVYDDGPDGPPSTYESFLTSPLLFIG